MRRRGGTQPSPISKTHVVDAAMRVVARSSLEQLTVREVATECGVTPPAIHYHLRGGDDLADRVVEAVAAQIDVAVDGKAPWVERYLTLISAMDRAFLAYPGTGLRALASTGASPGATRLTDTAMRILRDAGLPEAAAVQTFTTTYLIFVGWLATRHLAEGDGIHPSLEAAGAGALANDGDQPLLAAIRRVLTAAEGEIT
ncbi:TetR/AcrR family transcriptional regulator [Mycobacterium sp. DL440]|uniref:TetR/AcrR family transcriptional regulator n=1 Tax=Mycobacterium sp. DL440 TaxID=2675523 RepID=UPI00141DD3C7|nr:TetR/AcrR family transcriptional regulator [Mycobacterium sp. DL440]